MTLAMADLRRAASSGGTAHQVTVTLYLRKISSVVGGAALRRLLREILLPATARGMGLLIKGMPAR